MADSSGLNPSHLLSLSAFRGGDSVLSLPPKCSVLSLPPKNQFIHFKQILSSKKLKNNLNQNINIDF